MFERFSESSIKVIMLAQEEARRLGHNFVGTEMLLLGILGEGTNPASKLLKARNVYLKQARVAVENKLGRGAGYISVEIPFTPTVKDVLHRAADHPAGGYITPEILMWALLQQSGAVALRVLDDCGIDLCDYSKSLDVEIAVLVRFRDGGADTNAEGSAQQATSQDSPRLEDFDLDPNALYSTNVSWDGAQLQRVKDAAKFVGCDPGDFIRKAVLLEASFLLMNADAVATLRKAEELSEPEAVLPREPASDFQAQPVPPTQEPEIDFDALEEMLESGAKYMADAGTMILAQLTAHLDEYLKGISGRKAS